MNKPIIKVQDAQHLKQLVKSIIEANPEADLNHLDVSGIQDFSAVFYQTIFNGDVSQWDTSNALDMTDMFSRCPFNGDISNWNTSSVKKMAGMFRHSLFEGDISRWDVSQVTNMNRMFAYSNFNGDLSKWDTSNVETMTSIFSNSLFRGSLPWDVSKVKEMDRAFFNALFAIDIHSWKFHPDASAVNMVHESRTPLPIDVNPLRHAIFSRLSDMEAYLQRHHTILPLTPVHIARVWNVSKKPMYMSKEDFQWVKDQQHVCDALGLTVEQGVSHIYAAYQQKGLVMPDESFEFGVTDERTLH